MKDDLFHIAAEESRHARNLSLVALIISVLNIMGFIWVFKLVNS